MSFTEIKPTELPGNAISEISKRWMLLSAGTEEKFNFMTVSWGALGELWKKPAATAYVRHSRYTLPFVENNDCFTLTVLKKGFENALKVAGSKSGRDTDKIKESGLTPVFLDGCPTFEEADYVLICKKMYADDIKSENFIDKDIIGTCYSDNDYHRMFIGEIVKAYIAK